jgi:ketosteroid isomerase-like protein
VLVENKSTRDVATVNRSYRMLEMLRRDSEGAADRLVRELVDEGFELRLPESYPEGAQVFRGRDGLKRWTAKTREIWDEWRFEPEQFIQADDGLVLVLVHLVAEGCLSGVRLERDTAHVWALEDGKVTRCEVYLDRAEALDALGLEG